MLFKCLLLVMILLDLKYCSIITLSIHLVFLAFGKKIFPAFMDPIVVQYNEVAEPFKRKLFKELNEMKPESGKKLRILEIGGGTGANFKYYQVPAILDVVEPNPNFESYYDKNSSEYKNLDIKPMTQGYGEDLASAGFEDGSIDVVVMTLVLCSVNDQNKCYQEIHRVLRPGGKFLYLEHIIAEEGFMLRNIQQVLMMEGFWQFMFDGCCLDRDTFATVKQFSGWSKVEQERFYLPTPTKPFFKLVSQAIRPHVMGVASK